MSPAVHAGKHEAGIRDVHRSPHRHRRSHRRPVPARVAQRLAVVDDLPVGLLVADSRVRVVMANQAWSELTGLEEEASLGHGWLRCIAADDRRQVLNEVHRRLSGRQRHSVDYELCFAGER